MSAIRARALGAVVADRTLLHEVDLDVPWGAVTGFLGVNGAGKSTTIRRILGLQLGTGSATIAGARPSRLGNPARVVGVAFDELLAHPGHSAVEHLEVLAARAAMPLRTVPALLEEVGLGAEAAPGPRRRRPRRRQIAAFSLGMRKRLAIAGALVGVPRVLILDEPLDGLDPNGRRWLLERLRAHADGGGAVLLSAHGLDEIAPVLDRAIVLHEGRVRHEGPIAGLLRLGRETVTVRSPDAARLAGALRSTGATGAGIAQPEPDVLVLTGVDAGLVARIALDERILVVGLEVGAARLGDAFASAIGDA